VPENELIIGFYALFFGELLLMRILDIGHGFMKSYTAVTNSTLKKGISCPNIGEGLNRKK
jgi:hypothetical protein